MSPTKNTQSSEYKFIGTFHWRHFTEKGSWHTGVNSTAPRLEFMQAEGTIKEFVNDKKGTKFNVIFDAEYVFEYLYQKIIVNMGWENNGKLDSEILGYFLKDFADYCGEVGKKKQLNSLRQQAKDLSITFPSKTWEEWEEVLLEQLQVVPAEKLQPVSEDDNQAKENHHDNIYDFDYDLRNIDDEKTGILVTEIEALGDETKRTEETTAPVEDEEDTGVLTVKGNMEETIDIKSQPIKNTTEDVTSIVPVIEPKKRGRPRKS